MSFTWRIWKLTNHTHWNGDITSSYIERIRFPKWSPVSPRFIERLRWHGRNLSFGSIGVSIGLQFIILASSSISRAHFQMKMADLDWATSIPKMYHNLPSSLVWKCWKRCSFKLSIPSRASENYIISIHYQIDTQIRGIRYTIQNDLFNFESCQTPYICAKLN